MLVKTKGYLIFREDHGDFDEIIHFINEHGIKFKCYSLGSRKITSKNARNLDFGNYLEFELFYSENHLSKLKKVSTISTVKQEIKQTFSFLMLNDFFSKIDLDDKKFFKLYQRVLMFLLEDLNDYLIMLFIVINFIKLNGLSFVSNHCYDCNRTDVSYINLVNVCSYCDRCIRFNNDKYQVDANTFNIINQINSNDECDISIFNEFDIKKLSKLIKIFIYYLNENLNIYTELFKKI